MASEQTKAHHPSGQTAEILMFLAHQDGKWATWGKSFYMPSVQAVFPVGTTPKEQLHFMQGLQKEGLVGGCDCGCRGDYAPTQKGLDFLAENCFVGEQERKRWADKKLMLGY